MNCLECNNDFYLTEDTKSCYENVIDNYYLDYYLDNNILRRCHNRCKCCYSGPNNNKEMNCIECLNDEKNIYFYQNDTTNCLLDSEFVERENIVFNRLENYNFYIFIGIFIISLIVGFINFCCLFKGEKINLNNNIDYHSINNSENVPKKRSVELPDMN